MVSVSDGLFDGQEDSHFYDALGQIGWDFGKAFSPAVHDVVVAGAAGRTDGRLGSTRPRLCLSRAWKHKIGTKEKDLIH